MLTAKAWTDLNTTTNVWGSTSYAGSYENNFTYDANGNILTQLRKNQAGTTIDNLTYNYYNSSGKLLQNRLYHVNDAVSSGSFSDDIDNMNRVKADGVTYRSPAVYTFLNTSDSVNVRNNYSYDAEGRLVRDRQEEISQISWRVDGKVAEVQRTVGSSRKRLKFDYDAMGQRIAKHQYAGNAWEKSTYYVRDAQGNVLATYNKENPGTATMKVTERDIYGSARVGMYKKEVEMISATTPSVTAFQHETGLRQYEISNHLGNVLAVVTDRKRPLDLGDYDVSGDGINDTNTPVGAADNRTDYYQAEIVMSGDYSPFGVTLDGRSFSSSAYRHGFNGMEKDDEVKGDGNSYTTEFRQYDPRVGRWLSLDPLASKFPWQSPFVAYDNNPITTRDPRGLSGESTSKSAVQKGEGAFAFANRNNITVEQLVQWNPSVFKQGLTKGTYMLHPGQQLNVSQKGALEDKGSKTVSVKSGQISLIASAGASTAGIMAPNITKSVGSKQSAEMANSINSVYDIEKGYVSKSSSLNSTISPGIFEVNSEHSTEVSRREYFPGNWFISSEVSVREVEREDRGSLLTLTSSTLIDGSVEFGANFGGSLLSVGAGVSSSPPGFSVALNTGSSSVGIGLSTSGLSFSHSSQKDNIVTQSTFTIKWTALAGVALLIVNPASILAL